MAAPPLNNGNGAYVLTVYRWFMGISAALIVALLTWLGQEISQNSAQMQVLQSNVARLQKDVELLNLRAESIADIKSDIRILEQTIRRNGEDIRGLKEGRGDGYR